MIGQLLIVVVLSASTTTPVGGALALSRFGYGPRGSERAAIDSVGWTETITRQLAWESIDDTKSEAAVAALGALPATPAEAMAAYPRPNILQKSLERIGQPVPDKADMGEKPQDLIQLMQARRLVRAVTSERQMYEAMVEFWSDHFNIYARKKGIPYAIAAFERDAVRHNALGSFATMLRAVAESPAMLEYLDNDDNVRPGGPAPQAVVPAGVDLTKCRYVDPVRAERQMRAAARGPVIGPKAGDGPQRGINENYARELMELHTLGVDGGYTQKDITEVARAFTGWTVFDGQGARGCPESGRAFYVPELHDGGDKMVLGHIIRFSGRDEALQILDMLAHHPKTAHFIAFKLVKRFVADEPPPALVERAAAVFLKTGGDIRATMKVIATDPLTLAAAIDHKKVKRPFDLVVSSLRALDATTDGAKVSRRYLGGLNQLPYLWLTPNGYPEDAGRWTDAGALTQRLRFGLDLASNTIGGTDVDLGKLLGPIIAYGGAASAEALVDEVGVKLVGTSLSPSTRSVVIGAINEMPASGVAEPGHKPDPRVARAVGLILGSPEFQHR